MPNSRKLLLVLGAVAVAGLAGITGWVMADDGPSRPGDVGGAEHGSAPAESELLFAASQVLASLAFINDPTIKCDGGPCLGGSREDVARAIITRCEKVGGLAFTKANPSRPAGNPTVLLDRALSAACDSVASVPIDGSSRLVEAARNHLEPLSEALLRAQAAIPPSSRP